MVRSGTLHFTKALDSPCHWMVLPPDGIGLGRTLPFSALHNIAQRGPCHRMDGALSGRRSQKPWTNYGLSTLNVASMSRNQDLLKEPSQAPTVNVYTETCLTKTVLPSAKARTKEASRFLVTGSMVAPRKNLVKLDSHARGDSGGVLLVSDVPSRPSSTPMDPPAWHSTRLCEALVPFTSQITVRVIGFYGFAESSPRSTSNVELNNNLVSYLFKYVSQSTLPCVLMGDFNGDIEQLPFWHTLKTWGWQDAAALQNAIDGKPIEPTWKATTRLDCILIPPQLLPFFVRYDKRIPPRIMLELLSFLVPLVQTHW